MNYTDWKTWLRSKPWVLKWFIILVLTRPVIDNFYFLKEISPFLSPLYIVGLSTPILIIIARIKIVRPFKTKIDSYFKYWAFFIYIGTFFVVIHDPFTLFSLELLLKLLLPVYIYFFARIFIRSKRDIDGLLTTYLYSGIFVAAILLYEVLINPIRIVESRGVDRIQGNFGDVVSYGVSLTFCFLIATYFYFSKKVEIPKIKRVRIVIIVSVLCVLTLVNIHHVASYTVFIGVLLLFIVFNFKENRGAAFILSFLLFSLFFAFGKPLLEEKITPLIETDISIYEGEGNSERLLHGRVGRWKKIMTDYIDQNAIIQFFGYSTKPKNTRKIIKRINRSVGVYPHNDYIRILFLCGYFGLFYYLVLLLMIFHRAKKMLNATKYLVFGTLVILMLFSISVVPTYYPPFMYVVMSVFAYVALPEQLQK